MMKAERAILSNFNTKSCIFQRMFAVKERGCCRNSGGLLNHPSISAQSECPNIRRFEGDSYSAAHVRLAELVIRQIVAEFQAQILHGAGQHFTAIVQQYTAGEVKLLHSARGFLQTVAFTKV
ncbi:hypothetical protein D3C81_1381440 [compost metagenome]